MGVQIYILEPKTQTLRIGDLAQEIGTLRRSWKVTEFDFGREVEIERAKTNVQDGSAPAAVMLAEITELTLARSEHRLVAAHLVLGWDHDRSSVTDFAWDYLPVLGYAIRTDPFATYILHEATREGLLPISRSRAIELGIYNQDGQFIRQGQPSIVICNSVKPYIKGFFEAECVLSDGRSITILTSADSSEAPDAIWYVGKRPSDASRYGNPQ